MAREPMSARYWARQRSSLALHAGRALLRVRHEPVTQHPRRIRCDSASIGTGLVADWNDAPSRTQDEVVAALVRAAEIAEALMFQVHTQYLDASSGFHVIDAAGRAGRSAHRSDRRRSREVLRVRRSLSQKTPWAISIPRPQWPSQCVPGPIAAKPSALCQEAWAEGENQQLGSGDCRKRLPEAVPGRSSLKYRRKTQVSFAEPGCTRICVCIS